MQLRSEAVSYYVKQPLSSRSIRTMALGLSATTLENTDYVFLPPSLI